jgi:hypothetical protein
MRLHAVAQTSHDLTTLRREPAGTSARLNADKSVRPYAEARTSQNVTTRTRFDVYASSLTSVKTCKRRSISTYQREHIMTHRLLYANTPIGFDDFAS